MSLKLSKHLSWATLPILTFGTSNAKVWQANRFQNVKKRIEIQTGEF